MKRFYSFPDPLFRELLPVSKYCSRLINEKVGKELLVSQSSKLYSKRLLKSSYSATALVAINPLVGDSKTSGILRQDVELMQLTAKELKKTFKRILDMPIVGIGSNKGVLTPLLTDTQLRKWPRLFFTKECRKPYSADIDSIGKVLGADRKFIDIPRVVDFYVDTYGKELATAIPSKDFVLFDDTLGTGVTMLITLYALQEVGISLAKIHPFSLILEQTNPRKPFTITKEST